MNVIGLFGLLALGTILYVIQMFTRKSPWDLPMILTSIFCFGAVLVGFTQLAFSH